MCPDYLHLHPAKKPVFETDKPKKNDFFTKKLRSDKKKTKYIRVTFDVHFIHTENNESGWRGGERLANLVSSPMSLHGSLI